MVFLYLETKWKFPILLEYWADDSTDLFNNNCVCVCLSLFAAVQGWDFGLFQISWLFEFFRTRVKPQHAPAVLW